MASGEVVGAVLQSNPPSANRADPGNLGGGTTGTTDPGAGENFPVIRFDDSSDEYWDFSCALEANYDSGGIDIELVWSGAAATGNVGWNAALRRKTDDAEDLDSTDHSYSYQSVTAAAPSAVGEVSYDTISFTDGAQMDSTAAGERFNLRIYRDTTVGSNMSGDAELHWPDIIIRES